MNTQKGNNSATPKRNHKRANMQELLLALKEKYNISDEDAQKVIEALMEQEKQRGEAKTARRSRGLLGDLFGVTETLLGASVKGSAQMMGIMGELLDRSAQGSAEMLGIINDVLGDARRDDDEKEDDDDDDAPESTEDSSKKSNT